jgi:predicted XRE-type DNA-binding protein
MSTNDNTENVVIDSSGDVFADLGLHLSEQDTLKVIIAHAITSVVQDGAYTQAEAATIMGIDQPKVSKLMRGRLKEFTADRLVECFLLLGYDIQLAYRKSSTKKGKVRLVA